MQKTTECLNPNISHTFIYLATDNGQSDWVCRLCGAYVSEFEDCQL